MYQRQHRKTYKQLLESTRASMGARVQDLEARLGDDYDPDMDEAGYIALASKFGAAQYQLNAAKDVLVCVSSECVYAYVPVDFFKKKHTRGRLRRTPNPAPTPTDCALGPRARRGACALVRAGLGGGDSDGHPQRQFPIPLEAAAGGASGQDRRLSARFELGPLRAPGGAHSGDQPRRCSHQVLHGKVRPTPRRPHRDQAPRARGAQPLLPVYPVKLLATPQGRLLPLHTALEAVISKLVPEDEDDAVVALAAQQM